MFAKEPHAVVIISHHLLPILFSPVSAHVSSIAQNIYLYFNCYLFSPVVCWSWTFGHFQLLLWNGWINFNQFGYIISMGKWEQHLKFHGLCCLGNEAKTSKINVIFKIFLLMNIKHDYKEWALYQNCGIHDPWIKSSCYRVGQSWLKWGMGPLPKLRSSWPLVSCPRMELSWFKISKMYYIVASLLYSWKSRRQNVCMIIMNIEPSNKGVKSMTFGFRYRGGARLVMYMSVMIPLWKL